MFEAQVIGSPIDGKFDTAYNEPFFITFTLPDDIMEKKVYDLDQTVTVEGQEITFRRVIMSPLRTEVQIAMNPHNTKTILGFDDLHLVDETGETWGEIINGEVMRKISEYELIIYLQSNYFNDPEELYLSIYTIQAVDNDERLLIVDPVKEEILKQPKGNLLLDVPIDGSYLVFTKEEDINHNDTSINIGQIYNEDGDHVGSSALYDRSDEIGVRVDDLDEQTSPLFLEIVSFPSWIKNDEKIRVK